jgi:hypothetical protein
MHLKQIVLHAHEHFKKNSNPKKAESILSTYAYSYLGFEDDALQTVPLNSEEEQLPFYEWYYLNFMIPPSLAVQNLILPPDKEGRFDGFECQPVQIIDSRGFSKPCQPGEEHFWAVFAKRTNCHLYCIANCKEKIIARFFISTLTTLLHTGSNQSEKTFTPAQLRNAIVESIYLTIKN